MIKNRGHLHFSMVKISASHVSMGTSQWQAIKKKKMIYYSFSKTDSSLDAILAKKRNAESLYMY